MSWFVLNGDINLEKLRLDRDVMRKPLDLECAVAFWKYVSIDKSLDNL